MAAGDLALRGAHPRETVELLFDRCQSVLIGNTDCYIAGNYLGGAYREREHWKTRPARVDARPARSRADREARRAALLACATPRAGGRTSTSATRTRATSRSRSTRRSTSRRCAASLRTSTPPRARSGTCTSPTGAGYGRMLIADVASAGIPRDGDVRPAYGALHVHAQGLAGADPARALPGAPGDAGAHRARVPGAPLLVHKLIEARYRHHAALLEAARRHSGPSPGAIPGPQRRRPCLGSRTTARARWPPAPSSLLRRESPPTAEGDGPDAGEGWRAGHRRRSDEDADTALAGGSRTLPSPFAEAFGSVTAFRRPR